MKDSRCPPLLIKNIIKNFSYRCRVLKMSRLQAGKENLTSPAQSLLSSIAGSLAATKVTIGIIIWRGGKSLFASPNACAIVSASKGYFVRKKSWRLEN